jgi:hypothetical protein
MVEFFSFFQLASYQLFLEHHSTLRAIGIKPQSKKQNYALFYNFYFKR